MTDTGQGHFCGAQWGIWKPQERAGMTHEATMTPKAKTARKMEMTAPPFCRFSSSFWYCRVMRGCPSTVGDGGDNPDFQATTLAWPGTHTHLLTQQPQPLSPSSLPVPCPPLGSDCIQPFLKFCVLGTVLGALDTSMNPTGTISALGAPTVYTSTSQ